MDDRQVWMLAPDGDDRVRYLRGLGWRVRHYQNRPVLRQALGQRGVPAGDVLVLMADVAVNCLVAEAVRADYPAMSLLAVLRLPNSPEHAALLRVGVDCILRQDDPPALMASALCALAYRGAVRDGVRQAPFTPRTEADRLHRIGPWHLSDQGWCLRHRDGASLRLTVSERAVLLCLFEAPGHVASHADIRQAVRQSGRRRVQDDRNLKCRDIISRLRARARAAGLREPPVESLRDFGYAWAL